MVFTGFERYQKSFGGASNAKNQNICGKKIYTMNPCRPIVSHVAVKEGKILGAGSLEELASWGEFDLDDTFNEKVILPGFVEGHAHHGRYIVA